MMVFSFSFCIMNDSCSLLHCEISEIIFPSSYFFYSWKSLKFISPLFNKLFRAWMINRIASTNVSIQIHLFLSVSHTSSSSISSLTSTLIASYKDVVISMEFMSELMGMQSYAEWVSIILVSRCLRDSLVIQIGTTVYTELGSISIRAKYYYESVWKNSKSNIHLWQFILVDKLILYNLSNGNNKAGYSDSIKSLVYWYCTYPRFTTHLLFGASPHSLRYFHIQLRTYPHSWLYELHSAVRSSFIAFRISCKQIYTTDKIFSKIFENLWWGNWWCWINNVLFSSS